MPESLSALPSTQALDPFDHNGCQHATRPPVNCQPLAAWVSTCRKRLSMASSRSLLYMLAGDNHPACLRSRPSTWPDRCVHPPFGASFHCPHMPCSRRRRAETRKVLCRHGSILLMVTWGLLHHACQRNQHGSRFHTSVQAKPAQRRQADSSAATAAAARPDAHSSNDAPAASSGISFMACPAQFSGECQVLYPPVSEQPPHGDWQCS